MSRQRHLAVAALTFGVTLGAGLVAEKREAIESALGLHAAPARASTSIAASGAIPVAVADPARLPDLAIEVAGPAVLAGEASRPAAPAAAAIAGLADVVPVAFEAFDAALGGLGAEVAPAPGIAAPTWALAEPSASREASACTVAVEARAAEAAMIDLAVAAPCAAGGALTIHHAGLVVRVAADAEGAAALRLPALAARAAIMVEDPTGATGVAAVAVPDLAGFDRAVLQWQGAAGPEMHAREFGAAYGAAGDVWAGAPGAPEAAMAGTGGFLVRLGDPDLPAPMMAEVYTFPTGASRAAGVVDLTVEAQVSAATCGRDLLAQTIQVSPGLGPATMDLELPMPGCEAEGEWLVLDGLLSDLRVAAL